MLECAYNAGSLTQSSFERERIEGLVLKGRAFRPSASGNKACAALAAEGIQKRIFHPAWVATLSLFLVLISSHLAFGCSWATGYFHQITVLRGRVVGRNLQRYGPLGYVRWLRQKPVSAARLKLYAYVWPLKDNKELREVAAVKSDGSGNFDFGTTVPEGHYFLAIEAKDLSDWYEVEITKKARATKSVMIDISPNYPDCKGGHEFFVYN